MSNSIQPVTTNNQSINQQTTSTSTVDNSALDQTCQFRDNPTFHLIAWIDPIATGKLFLSIIGTLIILKHGNPLNWLLHLAYWGLIGMYPLKF